MRGENRKRQGKTRNWKKERDKRQREIKRNRVRHKETRGDRNCQGMSGSDKEGTRSDKER